MAARDCTYLEWGLWFGMTVGSSCLLPFLQQIVSLQWLVAGGVSSAPAPSLTKPNLPVDLLRLSSDGCLLQSIIFYSKFFVCFTFRMIMLTTNLIAMRSKIKCNVMPRPVFWLSKNTEKLAMKRLSSKPENVTFRNKRGQVSIDCLDFDKSIEHSVYAIGVFVNKWGRPTSSFLELRHSALDIHRLLGFIIIFI